eukprot:9788072-Ditylum_brightwellii.AAC.1
MMVLLDSDPESNSATESTSMGSPLLGYFPAHICLFGRQATGVRVRVPAGGDLVGSPGFILGAPSPPEAVREAINVATFRWSVLPR